MRAVTVAVLYIDPRGPYPRMAGREWTTAHNRTTTTAADFLDCYDASRDARTYDGPHPIVAHPPCGPWGRLRHRYRGNEHDCAPRAVEQVRRWGGVLEHPAGSRLWAHCGLPDPGEHGDFTDAFGGYTIEVDQVEWGHVARKRTWLYLVGVPREALEAPPFPGREPTHWITGGRGRAGKKAKTTPVPPGIKIASEQQRRRTPPLFAEYLVRLARSARREALDSLDRRAAPAKGRDSGRQCPGGNAKCKANV